MKAAALQKISQLSSRNNSMTLMGSNGGLRNALPEKKYNQNSGHLVSRFFNKSEYLSSEDGLRRADGIGESYAVLSNVRIIEIKNAILFLEPKTNNMCVG